MAASRIVPDLDGWLFALRTFAAAMLALAIAFSMGLDRPYWAMASVYIVSQPLSGALRSKGLYRFIGTLVGAAVTIVLVPNLADAPALLSLALALWIGFCLYLAVLDATPRSYAFSLAGYTTALIGFPVVDTPDTIWDVAVARVEEITLGIACATVIGTVVFPRPVGPVLRARIVNWRTNADRLVQDALAPPGRLDRENRGRRLRLAADAVELRTLTMHLAYDTTQLFAPIRLVLALEQRLVILLPVLAAIRDYMCELRGVNGITPGLADLLARISGWIDTDPDKVSSSEAMALREAIDEQEKSGILHGWPGMLRDVLLTRLHDLVDLRDDFLSLRQQILLPGGRGRMPNLTVRLPERPAIHRDRGLAALRGITMAAALLVTCTFWIASGWPDGALAAELVAVACAFTAALDDPLPSLVGLLVAIVLASIFAAIGTFAVLPHANGFEMLSLAMAGFFIPASVLGTVPATQKLFAAMPIFAATLLAIEGNYQADFAAWANGTAAAVVGVGTAVAVSAILAPAGAAIALRHRLHANWADLAAAARTNFPPERLRIAGLFMDRLGLVAPLLASTEAEGQVTAVAAMEDVRVVINTVDLNAQRKHLPPPLYAAVEDVLLLLAGHYGARAAAERTLPPPENLLPAIDRALEEAEAAPAESARGAVRALVGLRCNLFADAPPYRLSDPPAPAENDETTIQQGAAA